MNAFQSELIPFRSSKLLGERLRFERCTWVSFSPDALYRVLTEDPISRVVEENSYSAYRALLAWDRSETSGSRMQQKTRADLEELFEPARTRGGVKFTIDYLDAMPVGLGLPWRLTRMSYWRLASRFQRRLLTRLAYYERAAAKLDRIEMARRADAVPALLRQGILYWHNTTLGMTGHAAMLLDATLHHLAWIDEEWGTTHGYPAANALVSLANPKRRVMRHWFDILQKSTRSTNLLELHQLLLRRGARIHGNAITHGRLKKWASSSDLLPFESARVLLTACFGEAASERPETRLLWAAKLLTFLTEMVRGFSAEPVAPLVAQRFLHERLLQIQEELRATKGASAKSLFFL